MCEVTRMRGNTKHGRSVEFKGPLDNFPAVTIRALEDFPKMDDGLTALITYIAQLDLDDINRIQSFIQDGSSGGRVSDHELAMVYFAEEAQGLLNVAKARLVADQVVPEEDAPTLLDQLLDMEDMARYDREMAIALSEGREPPPRRARPQVPRRAIQNTLPTYEEVGDEDQYQLHVAVPADGEDRLDSDTTSVFSYDGDVEEVVVPDIVGEGYLSEYDVGEEDVQSDLEDEEEVGSLTHIAEDEGIPHPFEFCTACGDLIYGASVSAECGHVYDIDCMKNMFRTATVDESAFPPNCCQIPIFLESVRPHLGSELTELFQKKAREFTTMNRVYCYRPTCSTFIGAATTKVSSLVCLTCYERTCGYCKEQAHGTRACSVHLNQAVLDMAKKHGWQRCPACSHLVELTHGCFHMQCICKKQFCYLCGTTWKECSCPQFDENRL